MTPPKIMEQAVAAEREACAKLADEAAAFHSHGELRPPEFDMAEQIATAIRARGAK